MKKNILSIQMNASLGKSEENYAKVSSLIDGFYMENKTFLPDIIILPEVWTVGWYPPIFQKLADNKGFTEAFLSNIASKYSVNIIGGSYVRQEGNTFTNTCPVFDRCGKLLTRYNKIHLYSPDGEKDALSDGLTPVIVNIEGLNIGLSICYDIRFPELFRSYINSPVKPEFLINMSAWPKTRAAQYAIMAASRAIENQAYFLALSQTGHIKDGVYNCGNSIFIDPMGAEIARLGEVEGYLSGTVDTGYAEEIRTLYPNLKNIRMSGSGFVPEYTGSTANV